MKMCKHMEQMFSADDIATEPLKSLMDQGMKECKYTELFSNNDIATEILSRLPLKSLMAFKCTAKTWYTFLSDPLFSRIHYQRSNDVTGLVMQNMTITSDHDTVYDSIDLLTPTKTGYALNYKLLDFLPEKVMVLSSSHGILCCRSWVDEDLRRFQKTTVTYICNPITRQWVQFRSKIDDYRNEYRHIYIPGFVFYPFDSLSSWGAASASMFKLVKILYNHEYFPSYFFDIYSSATKKWKRSKAVCKTRGNVSFMRVGGHPPRVIFANGWLHWWTTEYEIVAFHVENEVCKVIKLPCAPSYTFVAYDCGYICWGESEGYFHYVYALGPELQVWVLKNYEEEEERAWELKYWLDMVRFSSQHPSLRLSSVEATSQALCVLTFHEDVVYIKPWGKFYKTGNLVSYDFRTKTLIDHGMLVRQSEKDPDSTILFSFKCNELSPIIVPFSASLVPLQGVRRSQRNRKWKFLEI